MSTAMGGENSSSSQMGCVHVCSLDNSVIPKTTRGMMISDPNA